MHLLLLCTHGCCHMNIQAACMQGSWDPEGITPCFEDGCCHIYTYIYVRHTVAAAAVTT